MPYTILSAGESGETGLYNMKALRTIKKVPIG
jgi:hypothetical protein